MSSPSQMFSSLYTSQYQSTANMAILSTALYGVNIAVAIGCINFMTGQRESKSRRRNALTCLYIAMMVTFASQAVVSTNVRLNNGVKARIVNPDDFGDFLPAIFDPPMPIALPLAVWGADALLIYRCIILYKLVDRRVRIALYTSLTLAALVSLSTGIVAYWFGTPRGGGSAGFAQLVKSGITPSTIAVNGAVSLLIAGRLLYAQRLLYATKSVEKNHISNPYMTAMAICVESSALIIVAGVASIMNQEFTVVVPQVSVLAPLLIIYRVAQGREEATITRLEQTLAFHHSSTPTTVTSSTM